MGDRAIFTTVSVLSNTMPITQWEASVYWLNGTIELDKIKSLRPSEIRWSNQGPKASFRPKFRDSQSTSLSFHRHLVRFCLHIMAGYWLGGALGEGGTLGIHEQYLVLFGYKIPPRSSCPELHWGPELKWDYQKSKSLVYWEVQSWHYCGDCKNSPSLFPSLCPWAWVVPSLRTLTLGWPCNLLWPVGHWQTRYKRKLEKH